MQTSIDVKEDLVKINRWGSPGWAVESRPRGKLGRGSDGVIRSKEYVCIFSICLYYVCVITIVGVSKIIQFCDNTLECIYSTRHSDDSYNTILKCIERLTH